jgi:CBS domain-containing protein
MNQPSWELPNRVRDLMSSRLVTVNPDVDLAFAMQLMLWSGVRHLPVVEDEDLVGILSDRDFLPTESGGTMKDFLGQPVRQVMTSEVKTIAPDEDARTASAMMATAHINALPVVDEEGALIGIVTSSDILAERGRLFFKVGAGEVPGVEAVMTRNPSVAHRDDSVREVAMRMIDEGIRHMPVVDEGSVVGMLSERDLRGVVGDLRGFLDQDETPLDSQRVDEVMTPNPVTVPLTASLFDLASCYIDDRIGAVPVVDEDDKLVGVVSYVDLLGYLMKGR